MAITNSILEVNKIHFFDGPYDTTISPVQQTLEQIEANSWNTKLNPNNMGDIQYLISKYHQPDGQSINNADAYAATLYLGYLLNSLGNLDDTPGGATWHPSTEFVRIGLEYDKVNNTTKVVGITIAIMNKTTMQATSAFAIGRSTNVCDYLDFNFMLGSFPPQEGAELLRVYWNTQTTFTTWNMIMLSWQGEYDGAEPLCNINWGKTTSSNPHAQAGFTYSFERMSNDLPTLRSLGLLKDQSFQTIVNDIVGNATSGITQNISKQFITR